MKRRWIGLFLTAAILLSCIGATVYAADGHTYYSQKGWKYNGKNLTSMCYATCIAMSLSDLGKSVTPLDIYINNGYTAYCKANAATAKDFGVSWKKLVDNAGSMSADAKKAKLIQLLGTGDYPQGIMLYGGGHMILARKVENGVVYFDDPVYGCCLPIEKCDKTRYSNITLMGCFYNNNLTQNPEGSTPLSSNPFYTIRNVGSDKMLNIRGNSSASNTNVTVYQADGTTGQMFQWIDNGNGCYVIEPQCAPSCALNVYGSYSTDGSNVTTWTKTGHSTQSWIVAYNSSLNGYVIRSADNEDYVLTAAGSTNSSNANQGLKGGRKTAQKSIGCKNVANKPHQALLCCL